MNGLCWEAGCSIRGLPPAGAEARRSSTGRCGGRGGGCWEGKRSSWAGGRPSWPGLHHREEAPVGLRGPLIHRAWREAKVTTHWRRKIAQGPVPTTPCSCAPGPS